MWTFPGGPACSVARRQRHLARVQRVDPRVTDLSVQHVHVAKLTRPLTDTEEGQLQQLLTYGAEAPVPMPSGPALWVGPRVGTVSPWSSKATEIAHVAGPRPRGGAHRAAHGVDLRSPRPRPDRVRSPARRPDDGVGVPESRRRGRVVSHRVAGTADPADAGQPRRSGPQRRQPGPRAGLVRRRDHLLGERVRDVGTGPHRRGTDDVCPSKTRSIAATRSSTPSSRSTGWTRQTPCSG